ncbi:erythronate-4-phosphate dehydrogenase [Psychrobacter sp. PL19]
MPNTLSSTVNIHESAQTIKPLIIVADINIAGLDEFFNSSTLGQATEQMVKIVTLAGRDINAQLLLDIQPDVLLIRSVTPIGESLLADNRSVTYIGSTTIGTDHVDQDYLNTRNITFANAAGCSKHSVAQYVLTAILTLRPQHWQQPMTLGIVGLGNIGNTLAQYATDLGWQVLGYDPLLPASRFNNASFAQVLGQSDVVSLHVPLTDNDGVNGSKQSDYPTRHLINAAALAAMPPHTMLINSARGPVINADDLAADIDRTARQVVLDVFEHEPQINESLLSKLAIATPHIAGYTLEGKLRGTQIIYDTLCEELAITPAQSMHNLLPVNMFLWSDLQAYPGRLIKYYDIMQDDALLRGTLVDGQVSGADFDQLRRDYHLRREWQF